MRVVVFSRVRGPAGAEPGDAREGGPRRSGSQLTKTASSLGGESKAESVGTKPGGDNRSGPGPFALLQAIAVPVHLQDMNVMGQPVQQGARHAFRTQDLGPFIERQIRGQQRRTALVALTEHFAGVRLSEGSIKCR